MTAHMQKSVFLTPSGEALSVVPGTERRVSVDEMIRRRDAWHAQYGHLLDGYSVAEFLREKNCEREAGNE